MKRTVHLIVGMAVVLAVLLAIMANMGCSSKGKPSQKIQADHSIPELTHALNAAESFLGMQHKGETIKVSFKVGTARHPAGWWGEKKTINGVTGILGGLTYRGNFMTLYTDPKTGKIHPCPAQHEMMRSVMYANGIRSEAEQDALLRSKGWKWCR